MHQLARRLDFPQKLRDDNSLLSLATLLGVQAVISTGGRNLLGNEHKEIPPVGRDYIDEVAMLRWLAAIPRKESSVGWALLHRAHRQPFEINVITGHGNPFLTTWPNRHHSGRDSFAGLKKALRKNTFLHSREPSLTHCGCQWTTHP